MTSRDDDILHRIGREAGVPGLVDVLAERLAPADLSSLLLEMFRRRAATRVTNSLTHPIYQSP